MNLLAKTKRVRGGEVAENFSAGPGLDPRSELRLLDEQIAGLEAEINRLNSYIRSRAWNVDVLMNRQARELAGADIEGNISRRDMLLTDLASLRQKRRAAEKAAVETERDRNRAAALEGEAAIRAKLTELVSALEAAQRANTEYYELRRSFKAPRSGWPYSCPALDKYNHKTWLRQAKKFLGGNSHE